MLTSSTPEPVFVEPLRSPEIDSRPGGPVRQPYVLYRPARQHRLTASIPGNRFLGSINVYKYGLWPKIMFALAAVMLLYVVVSMRIVSLSTCLHFLSSKKLLRAYEKVRFVSLVKSVVNIN